MTEEQREQITAYDMGGNKVEMLGNVLATMPNDDRVAQKQKRLVVNMARELDEGAWEMFLEVADSLSIERKLVLWELLGVEIAKSQGTMEPEGIPPTPVEATKPEPGMFNDKDVE